ncbi:MAG: TniB family NTP-binding protein [Lachnospiraceae bacterium]|nr:TniB family NTP-binding protein [Lachnospiraceae bacterium]
MTEYEYRNKSEQSAKHNRIDKEYEHKEHGYIEEQEYITKVDYSKLLPALLSGDELIDSLKNIPEYDPSVREQGTSERLMKLSDIYKVYLPSAMSVEIYNKLYLATVMSLQKKGTKLAVIQQNSNYRAMQGSEYRGIIGGADSFTIIGTSGIGKSSAIERAISIIGRNGIIRTDKPYSNIIPCLVVQCPFDCSSKGLLLEILRMVDITLDTKYYELSQRRGITTDILIGTVARVAINHIGLLIIDEIQHVEGHKSGKTLVNMLTQLINSSGISICMVGTPECVPFFEQAMQLARRSMGLKYATLPCDDYFREFCTLVYGYQYVRNRAEISDGVIDWLYEHSAGVISVVVSLIHNAQELAIFNGREILDIQALNEAFVKRLTFLHRYVLRSNSQEKKLPPKKSDPLQIPKDNKSSNDRNTDYNNSVSSSGHNASNGSNSGNFNIDSSYITIPELIQRSKDENHDVVSLLKEYITVTEIAL